MSNLLANELFLKIQVCQEPMVYITTSTMFLQSYYKITSQYTQRGGKGDQAAGKDNWSKAPHHDNVAVHLILKETSDLDNPKVSPQRTQQVYLQFKPMGLQ